MNFNKYTYFFTLIRTPLKSFFLHSFTIKKNSRNKKILDRIRVTKIYFLFFILKIIERGKINNISFFEKKFKTFLAYRRSPLRNIFSILQIFWGFRLLG